VGPAGLTLNGPQVQVVDVVVTVQLAVTAPPPRSVPVNETLTVAPASLVPLMAGGFACAAPMLVGLTTGAGAAFGTVVSTVKPVSVVVRSEPAPSDGAWALATSLRLPWSSPVASCTPQLQLPAAQVVLQLAGFAEGHAALPLSVNDSVTVWPLAQAPLNVNTASEMLALLKMEFAGALAMVGAVVLTVSVNGSDGDEKNVAVESNS
jgi:hypothetical protein